MLQLSLTANCIAVFTMSALVGSAFLVQPINQFSIHEHGNEAKNNDFFVMILILRLSLHICTSVRILSQCWLLVNRDGAVSLPASLLETFLLRNCRFAIQLCNIVSIGFFSLLGPRPLFDGSLYVSWPPDNFFKMTQTI